MDAGFIMKHFAHAFSVINTIVITIFIGTLNLAFVIIVNGKCVAFVVLFDVIVGKCFGRRSHRRGDFF